MQITRTLLLIFLFFAFVNLQNLLAGDQKQITVDWIYSDAGNEITALPRFVWLENNTAILLDMRKPKENRTFERFDPNSGKRKPIIDRETALQNLATLIDKKDTTFSISWPSEFTKDGHYAAYIFKDDIYLLSLDNSRFYRITNTEEKEKSAHFSPDGKKLAFIRDNNLFIYDIEQNTEKQLTTDGSETLLNGTLSWVYWEEIFGRRDIGYWWSHDSKSIAYLQSDESKVALMHFVHYKPQIPRVITQRYPKAGTPNPVVRLGVVRVDQAKTTWVTLPDCEYLVRVKWLSGDKQLAVQTMNRAQTHLDLLLVDYPTLTIKKVMRESDSAWVNINDDLYFLKDGKHFVWQSERDGYAHLYRFDMNGKLVNQITRGKWALRSSGGPFWLRRSVCAIDGKKGWIYFTSLKASSIERQLYRIKMDGSHLERVSAESGVHQITFSPDGKYYFDVFSNGSTPPGLFLHRFDGKLLRTIAEPRLVMAGEYNIQAPDFFTIPTSDGFPMPAEILKPAHFDPNKKYPIIYNIYGGPAAPTVFNAWRTNRYFDQILLRKGYLVVRFDNRSSTAISKKLENRLYKMMSGPIEMKDVIDGVRWLKSQPYVDADRFGIWGWSGGGSFTLNAMTHSNEFKAGISVAPVTDWHYYDSFWAEFAMKLPKDNPEGYEKTSFVKSAKNLHGRLLLVHGTYDDNVHPQNSWAFIEQLIQNKIQFDMMFYPMRKHGISDRPARKHLYTKMLEFWEKNL